MNLSLRKIISYAYGSITRRLYFHAAIVVIFLFIVISITIWAGNTLTMITAIARFERTHTVSRVEAIVALLKFLDYKKAEDLETFQAKIAITQSYNKVFSRLFDMRKDTQDAEFVRTLENTFSETDHNTAVIIVNRINVMYWHPILKEMVSNAARANAAGERLKGQVSQILAAKNGIERANIFAAIEKTEKEFISYETTFSKLCSDLSNEISTFVSYVSIFLLIILAGFISMLTYMISRTVLKQAEAYTLSLEKEIAERKKADEALAESEESYRNLFNLATDGIFILDAEGSFIDANKTAYERLGYTREELISLHISELDHPDFAIHAPKRLQQIIDQRGAIFESGHLKKDGSMMPVEVNSRLLEYKGQQVFFSIIRDISERKRSEEEQQSLEKQLLHAQKLESLGVLAGGIAHDFNNILTSIVGNAELALLRINKESPGVDNLHKIEEAAARAADLAKQMLAYSGKGKFLIENINLNLLLEDMLHMLEVSISKKAVLRLNLIPDLPSVEADSTQIRQIVMNLVINASEAIGDISGVIAVTTGCMDCNKDYLKDVWLDENLNQGLYVFLEIADTGCGMSKDTLAKLFDPFFTTKFMGRGLGMAAVLGIVRGHKGAIKVYSEPGKGTSFKILLPASDKPAGIFNHNSYENNWKGSGTVLLVDDEETVRGIGKEMLQEFGFTTITANDGREAVEIFKTTPCISLVILDLTMPHMDGEQCFRELRQLNPDVKVIMSSGFSEHEVTQKFIGKGLAGFIQKPYKLSVLKEAIQKI